MVDRNHQYTGYFPLNRQICSTPLPDHVKLVKRSKIWLLYISLKIHRMPPPPFYYVGRLHWEVQHFLQGRIVQDMSSHKSNLLNYSQGPLKLFCWKTLTIPNILLKGLHITCTFKIHDLVKPKEIINGFENRYWSLNTVCVNLVKTTEVSIQCRCGQLRLKFKPILVKSSMAKFVQI